MTEAGCASHEEDILAGILSPRFIVLNLFNLVARR